MERKLNGNKAGKSSLADGAELFYKLISMPADICEFKPDPIPASVLDRVLWAASRAAGNGASSPCSFVVLRDQVTRAKVHRIFASTNEFASHVFTNSHTAVYDKSKLLSILDAPLNVCVTCDMRRNSANAFGRRAIREVDVYATCMAVQNLWLAAQVEGLGVGWITIVDNLQLRELLRLPDEVVPIAYLCLGYSAETSHAIAPSSKIERCARPNTVYQEHWTDEGDQRSTEIRRLVASVID